MWSSWSVRPPSVLLWTLAALLAAPADVVTQTSLPAGTAENVDEVFADVDPAGPEHMGDGRDDGGMNGSAA